MPTQTGSIDLKSIKKAYEAETIAGDTNQYFWFKSTGSDTGAHITEIPQDLFLNNPTGGNVLVRSNGLAIRKGLTELATFSSDGLQVTADDGVTQIAHLGYGPGTASGGGTSDAPYYTLGVRLLNSTVGNYSTAEGYETEASGYTSHAEGSETNAVGSASHTEGYDTYASGPFSHAEGNTTTASGNSSHAEGRNTTASDASAHAEGIDSGATGSASHAQNLGTTAGHMAQTAIGKYNDCQADTALEIGNGDTYISSNALTVKWDGNVEIALDDTAATGTTDGDLYKAITDMGWEGDVVV